MDLQDAGNEEVVWEFGVLGAGLLNWSGIFEVDVVFHCRIDFDRFVVLA